MTSKHFYSSADGLVFKSLRGAALLNPSLKLHSASRTIYTTDRSPHAGVAVISGGGAGHEPAHAGYTGRGMLSASVSGEIFASPSSKQILNTIRLAAFGEDDPSSSTNRDILVIINNYTGDRLNFGLAIEKARLLFSSINIASVIVADDISLLSSPTTRAVGPRGLAGNILVCKVLGALAETGANLDQISGTIGALFGIYLNAYSTALYSVSSVAELNAAPLKALETLSHHTTAKPGDRTVIDALHPFCHALATSGSLNQAVTRSMEGAEATRGMKPKLGRAVYIGKTEATFNTPDPGAWGGRSSVAGIRLGFVQ